MSQAAVFPLLSPSNVHLASHANDNRIIPYEEFCGTVKNDKIANDLFDSIAGKGAFRRFKDTTRRHGIEQSWYRFKDEALKEIALEWCRDNDISWTE